MAYAILRFAKHKGGASKALSAHHERTKELYISNPDIDQSRTPQNFHLVTPPLELRAGDQAPHQDGRLPRPEGQREIRGHAGDGQPGVCTGTRGGDAGLFHAGVHIPERARR